MQPNRLGRILGIGTRVAAEKLRDGTAGAVAAVERSNATRAAEAGSTARTASAGSSTSSRAGVSATAGLAEGSRRVARGAGRFGASMWKPFAHASGILWLQITGLFFAFFAVGFAVYSWRLYKSAGVHDHHLPLYAFFAVLFVWFAVSSFWRAGRKQKRR